VAAWQQSVRHGDAEAIDLAEFIGGLQGEILDLEHRNALGERREEELRQQLERVASDRIAGSSAAPEEPRSLTTAPVPEVVAADATASEGEAVSLDAPPAEPRPVGDILAAAFAGAEGPSARVAQLLRLGRSGGAEALHTVSESLHALDALVRAAAYEALGHLLERDSPRFEGLVAPGLADADPRVRRRVILAVAAARGVNTRTLLEPLRGDPDAQVRRVAQQVLRTRPPGIVAGAPS
jgi:HEAT repeat protein